MNLSKWSFIICLILFASCEKTEENIPKLDKAYFLDFTSNPVAITWPEVIKYRPLYATKKIETGNSVSFTALGVYPIMAYTSPKDSSLVKVFVTNNSKKLKQLNDGNTYALVMRHSDATEGVDDFSSTIPEWWKSCEVTKARQINQAGIEKAKLIGENLKALDLPFGNIYSSEFCRCRQTVENMNVGKFDIVKELTYVVYNVDHATEVKSLMSKLPINNKVHLLNGHSQLSRLAPSPISFNWNDALIFKLAKDKEPEYVDIILAADWIDVK